MSDRKQDGGPQTVEFQLAGGTVEEVLRRMPIRWTVSDCATLNNPGGGIPAARRTGRSGGV